MVAESIFERARRHIYEMQLKLVQKRIKRLVHRLDKLNGGAFMALSLWQDDRTTYHVIAERHLENCYVYGTKVEYYNEDCVEGRRWQ